MSYIHLNTLVEFINMREGKEYKIVKSEEHGIPVEIGFKLIVPKETEIESLEVLDYFNSDDEDLIKIKNNDGKILSVFPKIVLWNEELYSTKTEDSICINSEDVDNGLLLFEDFNNIPFMISAEDIIRTVEGLQEL